MLSRVLFIVTLVVLCLCTNFIFSKLRLVGKDSHHIIVAWANASSSNGLITIPWQPNQTRPSRAELPMAHAEWYNGYGFIFLLFSFSMSLVYNLLVAMTQARITEVEAAGIIESSSAEGGSYRQRQRGDNKRYKMSIGCLPAASPGEWTRGVVWGPSSIINQAGRRRPNFCAHCSLLPACLTACLSFHSETLLLAWSIGNAAKFFLI